MARRKTIVGAEMRRLRYERGLSQDQFAAQLQLSGLELSRGSLSKIEAGLGGRKIGMERFASRNGTCSSRVDKVIRRESE